MTKGLSQQFMKAVYAQLICGKPRVFNTKHASCKGGFDIDAILRRTALCRFLISIRTVIGITPTPEKFCWTFTNTHLPNQLTTPVSLHYQVELKVLVREQLIVNLLSETLLR